MGIKVSVLANKKALDIKLVANDASSWQTLSTCCGIQFLLVEKKIQL